VFHFRAKATGVTMELNSINNYNHLRHTPAKFCNLPVSGSVKIVMKQCIDICHTTCHNHYTVGFLLKHCICHYVKQVLKWFCKLSSMFVKKHITATWANFINLFLEEISGLLLKPCMCHF